MHKITNYPHGYSTLTNVIIPKHYIIYIEKARKAILRREFPVAMLPDVIKVKLLIGEMTSQLLEYSDMISTNLDIANRCDHNDAIKYVHTYFSSVGF